MSYRKLGIPASAATVSLKAFNVIHDMSAVSVPAGGMMQPVLAGHETFHPPIFAFLIQHTTTGRRVMFDLGVRKDPENAAPPIAAAFAAGFIAMPVERDIVEQLIDDGVDLESISAVICSHAHFDHFGDMSKFPASTELVFGQSTVVESHAVNPKSQILESDLAGRKLVLLNFDESPLKIGSFKAHDFFGDGSFYVLDVPGHLAGHVCALARVTPTSFVFLGGDACHHVGVLRPTEKLHRHFPCPGGLLATTQHSVSAADFPPLNAAGQFDLVARNEPMLHVPDGGLFEDPPTGRSSVTKMDVFDANEDVFVMLAHDESLVEALGPFPLSLDDWQAKGWKSRVTWAFLDEANPAFRFKVKANQT
ncbi:Metallo-beta-lactamase superfamily protein [Mycena venus]|uniref:Metallo-beta-lactamase superfamily protein n=1 Tax=Mycena venus TaxID=2733690 RepID=A0A8H6YU97_9AGAR|nr:Metallo-beta-lactamase superfamily protein [Mycena venus]